MILWEKEKLNWDVAGGYRIYQSSQSTATTTLIVGRGSGVTKGQRESLSERLKEGIYRDPHIEGRAGWMMTL